MRQEIACPLDGTTASQPVIHENGYTGRQCDKCGLIYISPRPSRDEIEDLYADGDAYLSPEFFIATADAVTNRLTSRHDIGLIKRHTTGGSFLELGPGSGAALLEARRRGFDVYGVELNSQQASFIRQHHHIPCATSLAEARELGPQQFDVLYHRDVLSHFYDPVADMRDLGRLLRPGGLHVFETGNGADLGRRHFARIGDFQYPDHLFLYGEESLRRLLELSGLQHVKTYRYSRLPEQVLRSQIWRLTHHGETASTADDKFSGNGHPENGGSQPARHARPALPSRTGLVARDALDLTYLGLRLTLGKLAIRRDDPQTLIVIARRAG